MSDETANAAAPETTEQEAPQPTAEERLATVEKILEQHGLRVRDDEE